MYDQEGIICYHCEKPFYFTGFKFITAKTISCYFCKKRIVKSKAKEYNK